jgi:hypothetical protein
LGYEPDPIPIHYLVGRAVHFALYAYYEEGVHPAFAYQQFMENHIQTREPSLRMPDEQSKRYTQVQLGLRMVSNYFTWVTGLDQPDEDWETISNETTFHLPLFNKEGKKSRKISLGGRFDRIARRLSDGTVWLWEFKTTAREPDPDWLLLDNQVLTYCYAAEQIIGQPIEGIHFRFLKKKSPEKPHRIRGGSELSRAINSGSQGVHTTYDLYVEAIEELAAEQIGPKYAPDPVPEIMMQRAISNLMSDYAQVLNELAGRGWEEYFYVADVKKTREEIANATRDLWQLGLEMSRTRVKIYPAPEWQKCRFCYFREPCLMEYRSKDPSQLLHHTFVKRSTSEPDLDVILNGGEE